MGMAGHKIRGSLERWVSYDSTKIAKKVISSIWMECIGLEANRIAPTSCRLIVVVQSPPLYQKVSCDGKANSPRGPTIQLPHPQSSFSSSP